MVNMVVARFGDLGSVFQTLTTRYSKSSRFQVENHMATGSLYTECGFMGHVGFHLGLAAIVTGIT